ncbi:MAG: ATP-NAD kinase family protein [Anaerolineae bacterium]
MLKTVGLIVNPIAGMGGSVGLKGTDGEMAARARELGAEPVTPERTIAFLSQVVHRDDIRWWVAPGKMGEAYARDVGIDPVLVDGIPSDDGSTTAEDTRRIAHAMADDVDLLVFVGGDGTARDIYDAIDAELPVVGVPAGVKVYSGVFALSPRAAAEMVDAFCERACAEDAFEADAAYGGPGFTEAEVLDIDETAFRESRLEAEHYGYLLVPNVPERLQPGKHGSSGAGDTVENKRDIAAAFVEEIDPQTLYLLGPGTTIKAIADELGVDKTLLGIDAFYDGEIVQRDLNERQILALLQQHPRRKIVVTPLGGNGFIFGRGNKPFTPRVLREVGKDYIVVVATQDKMREVGVLRVDTGDPEVDEMLSGYIQVIVGYDVARVAKVRAESSATGR